ncbi:unnamed protein product [Symbiodinium pilosum]|uniref:Uncharacterized protein n=1 Tax=Symbiodinium pilosum TaxID=2952 RepID=A0A812RDY8_SYMPI|nr:unnamed protein product [Symbiodinium pilosum]
MGKKPDRWAFAMLAVIRILCNSFTAKMLPRNSATGLGASFVPSTGPDAAEDTKIRAQVQDQVQELAAQLSKEVANLAQQQKDIVDTQATVEDLASQLKAQTSSEDLAKLRAELASLVDRVASAESSCSATKKDI